MVSLELLEDIQRAACRLMDEGLPSNALELDYQLGELEALVYAARQAISDEWSAARTAHLRKRTIVEPATTLESLA